jgi:hypothetical protein
LDERGLAEFMIGKMAVAMASIAFIGAVISSGAAFQRQAGRDDLRAVCQAVLQAVETADSLPDNVELVRELPMISEGFSVQVTGSWSGGSQLVNVVVESKDARVSNMALLSSRLNGENFNLPFQNPCQVRVVKNSGLWLELV